MYTRDDVAVGATAVSEIVYVRVRADAFDPACGVTVKT
jgi:hypothetical protein